MSKEQKIAFIESKFSAEEVSDILCCLGGTEGYIAPLASYSDSIINRLNQEAKKVAN
mgnify:CR=1 FL=1